MATVVEDIAAPDRVEVGFAITKVEDGDDGSVYVYGKATDETLDHDKQVCDAKWASEAIPEWLSSGGNVRVMHSPNLYPAGRGVEVVEDGGQWVKSRVVEPTAVRLVKEGVLRAYSVGISQPKIIRDASAPGGRIVGGQVVELSLVDRPANPSCGVQLVKMASDDVMEEPEQAIFVSDAARDLLLKHISDEILTKAGAAPADAADGDPKDCPTCDGDGKIMEGNRTCPDCKGSGKFADMPDDKKADFRKKAILPGSDEYLAVTIDKEQSRAANGEFGSGGGSSKPSSGRKLKTGDLTHDEGTRIASLGMAHSRGEMSAKDHSAAVRSVLDGARARTGFKGADVEKAEVATQAINDLPDADFAFIEDGGKKDDTGKTVPRSFRHFPIQDAAHVRNALSRAPQSPFGDKAMPKIKAAAEKFGIEVADDGKADMPDVTTLDLTATTDPVITPLYDHGGMLPTGVVTVENKSGQPITVATALTEKTASGAPFGLRRLHDVVCACYSWDAVKSAYPILEKDGVAGALGMPTVGMLWQMLTQELAEDAGSGSEAEGIGCLGKAYAELCRFLAGEAMEQTLASLPLNMAEAKAALHKSFADANSGMPAMHPLNTGTSPVNPADYRKPYIAGGHAKLSADGAGSATVKPATPISADQFDRALITDGHEASSPSTSSRTAFDPNSNHAAEPELTKDGTARTFYTTAGKDRAKNVMTLLHAHIAEQFPELCPMNSMQQAEGAKEETVTLDDGSQMDVRADSGPAPVEPKAAAVEATLTKILGDDMAAAVTSAMDERLTSFKAEQTAVVAKVVAERDDMARQLEEMAADHKALIDAFGSQADPSLAPIRGNQAMEAFAARLAGKAAPVVEEDPAAIEKRQKMVSLQVYARDPNPAVRLAAEAEITKLMGT